MFRFGLQSFIGIQWPSCSSRTTKRFGNLRFLQAVATYYAAMDWKTPFAHVIETNLAPKTRIGGNAFVPLERFRALTEPIAKRIIEVSNDDRNIFDSEPGNPRVGWTAYVPIGSVARGREIVTTGGTMHIGSQTLPKTTACAGCHGPNLGGMDDIPPLAGRSASYLGRQLYDFQRETRIGRSSALMRVVVANLSEEDIVAITAYLASLQPVRMQPRSLTTAVTNTAQR